MSPTSRTKLAIKTIDLIASDRELALRHRRNMVQAILENLKYDRDQSLIFPQEDELIVLFKAGKIIYVYRRIDQGSVYRLQPDSSGPEFRKVGRLFRSAGHHLVGCFSWLSAKLRSGLCGPGPLDPVRFTDEVVEPPPQMPIKAARVLGQTRIVASNEVKVLPGAGLAIPADQTVEPKPKPISEPQDDSSDPTDNRLERELQAAIETDFIALGDSAI